MKELIFAVSHGLHVSVTPLKINQCKIGAESQVQSAY